jgi:hypothetical protein
MAIPSFNPEPAAWVVRTVAVGSGLNEAKVQN